MTVVVALIFGLLGFLAGYVVGGYFEYLQHLRKPPHYWGHYDAQKGERNR